VARPGLRSIDLHGAGLAAGGAALAFALGAAHAAAADPVGGLKPGLQLEGAQYLQDQSWFGQSQQNIGRSSGIFTEGVATPSLDATWDLGRRSAVYGRVSAVAAFTAGTDPSGSEGVHSRTSDLELEDSYIGWRSGDLLQDVLGPDAIDISIGRRKYQVGSGFLFWKESSNGASRAAAGIAPRQAARMAATAKLTTHGWTLDTVYLRFNDKPSTDTHLVGFDLAYKSKAWGEIGGGVYHFLGSDKATRAGMTMFDLRATLHPFPALRGVGLAGEYVHQENPRRLSSDAGFVGVGYDFTALPWAPHVDYRFALFRGDDPGTSRSEAYDPLAIGISNWGSLVISKWVQSNTDLRAHALRLMTTPRADLDLSVELFRFLLDRPPTPGAALDFAQEADVMAKWAATRRLTLSLRGALAEPLAAARARTGGDQTWSYLILDATWKY
jgi:hypothetical protein